MITLSELLNKVGPGPTSRAKKSKVISFRLKPNGRRFLFLVKSRETYSSKAGHIVSVFYPNVRIPFSELWRFAHRTPNNTRVRTFCSCAAWRFTGPSYLSTRDKYKLPEAKYAEERPATVRDPDEHNFICKHVVRVSTWLNPMTFRRMLALFQVPGIPDRRQSLLNELYPAIGQALRARDYNQEDIDDIIASLNDDNVEEILEQHGLIPGLGPDPNEHNTSSSATDPGTTA